MGKKSIYRLEDLCSTGRTLPESTVLQRLAISLVAGDDSITAAQQAAGVDRNLLNPVTEVNLALIYNKMKADQAQWEGDTYYSMEWNYFLKTLQREHFERVYAHEFKEPNLSTTEEFTIWVRRDRGYVVSANSSTKKSRVLSAHLYYELALPSSYESLTEKQHDFTSKGRGDKTPLLVGDSIAPSLFYAIDAREGLIRELRELEESTLSTNVPWRYVLPDRFSYLQLYDPVTVKTRESEDYEEDQRIKNTRTIAKLPRDIQEMLGWVAR